ncbi:50S ribosomal protein L25/general stress protein Ctc [Falsigemmobacter intermedius]|uniref:Large ribosomal subunit protein bL25 n=1 Tax=Falsigemmobacter intermedius TaxID=1553448 RepID=A0A3S3UHU8_9RHOB|nr:50S ribosomal protein L25/general stress protein Ctc [Falsigemmobacter intermedius]RWY41740.1 50S ribosomal protein L25/general stress protein Ctc [Falsigemmobacter intermedius]
MAKELPELLAEVRAGTGKGAARAARRENKVPGVIYGAGKEPVSINMNFHYLLKRLKQGRFLSTLFNLKVEGGEEVHVVCRGVQRDVVKDLPTHVDFMRVSDDSRINLFIHVDFINADKAPGIKRGGVLTTVRSEVELEVLAGNIPDHITVDLEGKKIGDVIHINDVVLPEGAKPTVERNFVIANIAAPSGLLVADEAAE